LKYALDKGSTLIKGKAIGFEFDELKDDEKDNQKNTKKKKISKERKVKGVKIENKDKKVELIEGDYIVIAMGPWSQDALNWLGKAAQSTIPKILGMKAHSIVMEPKEALTADCIFLSYRQLKGKHIDPEIYPRQTGEVYFCGISEAPRNPEPPHLVAPTEGACKRLKEIISQLSSRLAEAKQKIEQACYLPLTEDDTPLIGKLPTVQNVFIGAGHSCWGILLAPITGLCLSELLLDGKSSINLDDFNPQREREEDD